MATGDTDAVAPPSSAAAIGPAVVEAAAVLTEAAVGGPAEFDVPFAPDLIAGLSLPATVGDLAGVVERFAVHVDDATDADGWESWAAVAGLAVVAGELARRQLRAKKTRPRNPDSVGWEV